MENMGETMYKFLKRCFWHDHSTFDFFLLFFSPGDGLKSLSPSDAATAALKAFCPSPVAQSALISAPDCMIPPGPTKSRA